MGIKISRQWEEDWPRTVGATGGTFVDLKPQGPFRFRLGSKYVILARHADTRRLIGQIETIVCGVAEHAQLSEDACERAASLFWSLAVPPRPIRPFRLAQPGISADMSALFDGKQPIYVAGRGSIVQLDCRRSIQTVGLLTIDAFVISFGLDFCGHRAVFLQFLSRGGHTAAEADFLRRGSTQIACELLTAPDTPG